MDKMPGAGILSALNFRFEVIADLEDKFPGGVDVSVIEPGALAVLGTCRVVPGSMLVVIPPDVADKVRAMKKAHEAAAPRRLLT